MERDSDWYSRQIMENVGHASEEAKAAAIRITAGRDLTELCKETLKRIYDMVVGSKVR